MGCPYFSKNLHMLKIAMKCLAKITAKIKLAWDGSSANWKTPKQLTQTAMARINSLDQCGCCQNACNACNAMPFKNHLGMVYMVYTVYMVYMLYMVYIACESSEMKVMGVSPNLGMLLTASSAKLQEEDRRHVLHTKQKRDGLQWIAMEK